MVHQYQKSSPDTGPFDNTSSNHLIALEIISASTDYYLKFYVYSLTKVLIRSRSRLATLAFSLTSDSTRTRRRDDVAAARGRDVAARARARRKPRARASRTPRARPRRARRVALALALAALGVARVERARASRALAVDAALGFDRSRWKIATDGFPRGRKSCAFVSNDPSLRGLGASIDSHDEVIRLNNFYRNGASANYGDKVTYLVSNTAHSFCLIKGRKRI